MKKFFLPFWDTFKTVFIAVAAVFLVRTYVVQPFLVSGSSMQQTFYNGDYLLVDEFSYNFREPKRGEVIVFKYPGDHRTYYIKRIIGLPNERVSIKSGRVAVYDKEGEKILNEPYIAQNDFNGTYETTLENNQYFMMGDNRNYSYDSRMWGPLDRSDISGLVRFRLWPVNTAMAFSPPQY